MKKLNYRYNKRGKQHLLFLHGWQGSVKSFEFLESYFAGQNVSTINLDFWGFGISPEPDNDFTIYDYAQGVYELLKQNNITKVSIISHSFGSRVAIILASRYNVVDKLVIIDGAGIKPKFNLKVYLKIKWFKFLKFLVKIKLLNPKKLNKYGSKDFQQLSPTMQRVFKNVVNENLTMLLQNIFSPTLLIWGENDKETPLYMAKKMNKNIKDSGLVIYDKCGHFSYLEQPQRTCVILNKFLLK